MKAYVNYFDTDGVRARAKLQQNDIADNEIVVQFNVSPHYWKMSRMQADADCTILNSTAIRVKNNSRHLCHFDVEEVGPEEFAIFCGNHPDF